MLEAFAEHNDVSRATVPAVADAFVQLLSLCAESVRTGGKILFFGNGGSAADAQNFATELAVRFVANRVPIPAIALTTDSSVLTAVGNDLGFDHLFSRQVEALGRAGDIAIGISTSGRSANVIEGLRQAVRMDIRAAAMGGGDGGDLVGLADPSILIPSRTTARIQEMHIAVGQMLCGALEIELGLV
ncbi:MAG: SIS domain-containing protein [Alphaproteobacteria bacterium]|nr:SIS domain-containing protein [Alphaproteobacteria bacterium]